jgi:hypothetical protein
VSVTTTDMGVTDVLNLLNEQGVFAPSTDTILALVDPTGGAAPVEIVNTNYATGRGVPIIPDNSGIYPKLIDLEAAGDELVLISHACVIQGAAAASNLVVYGNDDFIVQGNGGGFQNDAETAVANGINNTLVAGTCLGDVVKSACVKTTFDDQDNCHATFIGLGGHSTFNLGHSDTQVMVVADGPHNVVNIMGAQTNVNITLHANASDVINFGNSFAQATITNVSGGEQVSINGGEIVVTVLGSTHVAATFGGDPTIHFI